MVASGAQLYVDASVNITNNLSLAGTGISGTGALRAGGDSVVNMGGILTLTNDTLFEVDGGTTLNLTNAAGITGSATAASTNVTLGAASGGLGVITGPLNLGSGALTKTGAGTWIIAPANTFTGGTSINDGTLEIANASALGPVSALFNPTYVTLNGGTLEVTANATYADGLDGFTVAAASTIDVPTGVTLVISNQMTGGGTLTKRDAGTLVLSGSNTLSGTFEVDAANNAANDGVVVIANPNAITGVATPIVIRDIDQASSTLELTGTNGNITVSQDITLNGRGPAIPAILNAQGTNTLAGNLTGGTGGLQYRVESDSGLLTLGSSGTLLTFSTTTPETFLFQGSGSFFVAGVIADGTANAGIVTSVEKDGVGGMTLGAANTYSGMTLVTGGSLTLDGGAIGEATNALPVTVSGGTLGGIGAINAQVNVGPAGTFAPGAPFGTLTVNSNLTLAGNMLVSVTAPSTSSQVAGLTSVAYGGTLTVSNVGGALAAGNSFPIFPATSFTGNFTGISPAPGPGLGWTFTPATGVLSVVSAIPTTPTNLTFTVSGGNLNLSWPESYQGWALQTNSQNIANTNDWFAYPGSTNTTTESIPISKNQTNVFFRLLGP